MLESFLQWRIEEIPHLYTAPVFMEQLELHIFETYSPLSLCLKLVSGFRSY